MNTEQYKDELHSLRDAISAFKACASWDERLAESPRLERQWRRMSMLTQPSRLPQRYRDTYESLTKEAADILNRWFVDQAAGRPEVDERPAPPEKAMRDTMRFCAMSKRFGF